MHWVKYDLTLRERRQRYRVTASQRRIGGELWQLTPLSLRVTPTNHIHLQRSPLPRLRHSATRRTAPQHEPPSSGSSSTLLAASAYRSRTRRFRPSSVSHSSYQETLIRVYIKDS